MPWAILKLQNHCCFYPLSNHTNHSPVLKMTFVNVPLFLVSKVPHVLNSLYTFYLLRHCSNGSSLVKSSSIAEGIYTCLWWHLYIILCFFHNLHFILPKIVSCLHLWPCPSPGSGSSLKAGSIHYSPLIILPFLKNKGYIAKSKGGIKCTKGLKDFWIRLWIYAYKVTIIHINP